VYTILDFVLKYDYREDIKKGIKLIKITMTITTVLSIYAMHALFRFLILLTYFDKYV